MLISKNDKQTIKTNDSKEAESNLQSRTIFDAMYNPPWLVTINTINGAKPTISSNWIYYKKDGKKENLLLLKNQKHILYSINLGTQTYFFNTNGNAYKYLSLYLIQEGKIS